MSKKDETKELELLIYKLDKILQQPNSKNINKRVYELCNRIIILDKMHCLSHYCIALYLQQNEWKSNTVI